MKKILIAVLTILTIPSCTQNKEFLFNGKDLTNWTIYLEDENVAPEDFFYVKDGVIETAGIPVGYMRTNKEYSNYTLHVEWRYPETPTNSGILLHVTKPDAIWISHYQAQLKHKNAGDFIVHGIGRKATVNDSVCVSTADIKPLIAKMNDSNEKEAGEWNTFDIICKDNTIEIKVNGLLQNEAYNCSITKGAIGLQAEGSKIQFRNLWVTDIE